MICRPLTANGGGQSGGGCEPAAGRRQRGWRGVLVLLAVFCIGYAVASRYCARLDLDPASATVKAQSPGSQRQHVVDRQCWALPLPVTAALFLAPAAAGSACCGTQATKLRVAPRDFPYNKPPPLF